MKKNFYAKKLDLNKQTVTNLRSGEMLEIYGGKALKNIQTNGNPPTIDITCPTMKKGSDTEPAT